MATRITGIRTKRFEPIPGHELSQNTCSEQSTTNTGITERHCMTKKRILIVDDDLACARILKMGLERTGRYDVQTESRATQALSAVRAFTPDLILLDICMIDGDGGDVACQLRNDTEFRHTPIVFMTSIVSE